SCLGGTICRGSENVQQRPAVVDLDARAEVERDAEVALEEPVLAASLLERVHREPARAFEPLPVARSLVELQERPAVARRPVTETSALPQRAGLPRQLARRDEDRVEVPLRRRARERTDDAGRSVAPLHAQLRARIADDRRPVDELPLAERRPLERLDDAVHQLRLVLAALQRRGFEEREDVACEAVREADRLPDIPAGDVLGPDARAELRVE